MKIWEMVGLWHYPIPGFFLLAQFCLGILVALGNLVNNSVFLCLSDMGGQSSNDYSSAKGNKLQYFHTCYLYVLMLLSMYVYNYICEYVFFFFFFLAKFSFFELSMLEYVGIA